MIQYNIALSKYFLLFNVIQTLLILFGFAQMTAILSKIYQKAVELEYKKEDNELLLKLDDIENKIKGNDEDDNSEGSNYWKSQLILCLELSKKNINILKNINSNTQILNFINKK